MPCHFKFKGIPVNDVATLVAALKALLPSGPEVPGVAFSTPAWTCGSMP
ncbi:hypothetical protein [Hyalangium sp.]|nr:hypothetical protein [Hyalangium sp.]HYI00132.1 hypothetical protein [Hyalangium sp.]